jgi:phosphonate transport system permease protein
MSAIRVSRSGSLPLGGTAQGQGGHMSAAVAREWQRFTPAQRLSRFAVYLALVAAVVVSLRHVEVIPEFLLDAPEQMQDLLRRMWPIAWDHYPRGVHDALMDTLHIATLGTLLAVLMALPIGIAAAHNVVPSRPVNWLARLLLVSSRSVNSLVWALLFVAVFGPGALAGTLAIAFRSIGFVGKLVGEALEETARGPLEALEAAGAPWPSRLAFGWWPQVKPAFWSIVLFRWDINVRESAVLGLVGAGGIGMALDSAMNLFQWNRVAMVLLAIFTVVVVAEVIVTQVRKRLL